MTHWSTTPFATLYSSIESGNLDTELLKTLTSDLQKLNTCPPKNESSRTKLESAKVNFIDGEYNLNKEFILNAVTLSEAINCDALVAAETMCFSTPESQALGTDDTVQAGQVAFYLRRQYILLIAAYLIPRGLLDISAEQILAGFQAVETHLSLLDQQDQKTQLLGQPATTKYQRDSLAKEYETLGEILHSACDKLSEQQFLSLLEKDHLSYLPALLKYVSKGTASLHSQMVKKVVPDLYLHPQQALVMMSYLAHFNSANFDFAIAVQQPMMSLVEAGAVEYLMLVCYSISSVTPYYDIVTLLQKHIPDVEAPSEHFQHILVPELAGFLGKFTKECGWLLAQLKDAEEDSMLSGEDLTLSDIAAKADLERFMIACYCFYTKREYTIEPIFLEWASTSTDTLMKACYYYMVSTQKGDETVVEVVAHYASAIAAGDETELNEEVYILLAGCLHVMSRDPPIDCIFELLKLKTPLVGAGLRVLASAPRTADLWTKIDRFLFQEHTVWQNEDEVLGFLFLLEQLLQPPPFGHLEFPARLGSSYRKHGIWPWLDKVFDAFKHSTELPQLREPCLRIMHQALEHFDSAAVANSVPAGINLDSLCGGSFVEYVIQNPALAVLNYLYKDSATLLQILSIGIDNLPSDESLLYALRVVDLVLDRQSIYQDELVGLVQSHSSSNQPWLPRDFGLHGLRAYSDNFLFKLPVLAHLGLYVGVPELCTVSLSILGKLASTYDLPAIFSSIDESLRIKYAFVDALETNPVEILQFVLTHKKLGQFLLGFGDEKSLFKSAIDLLYQSLDVTSYLKLRVAAMVFQLLVNSLNDQVWDILEKDNFYERVMDMDFSVDHQTLWCGLTYQESTEFVMGNSVGALLAFMQYRAMLIKFVGLLLHRASSKSETADILARLTKGPGRCKLFAFLDVLEFHFSKVEETFIGRVGLSTDSDGNIYDFEELDGFYRLKNAEPAQSMTSMISLVQPVQPVQPAVQPMRLLDRTHSAFSLLGSGPSVRSLLDPVQPSAQPEPQPVLPIVKSAAPPATTPEEIKQEITIQLTHLSAIQLQRSVLHSWCQLVQIVAEYESSFSRHVVQEILPKLNYYLDSEVTFAEELVSLCTVLYNSTSTDDYLLKSCFHGVLSPLSSLKLRSDLYILLTKMAPSPQSLSPLLDVVCNDAINGEIAAMLLLNVMNPDLGSLPRGHLLLLVRSLKQLNLSDNYDSTMYRATCCLLLKFAQQSKWSSMELLSYGLLSSLTLGEKVVYQLLCALALSVGDEQLKQIKTFVKDVDFGKLLQDESVAKEIIVLVTMLDQV